MSSGFNDVKAVFDLSGLHRTRASPRPAHLDRPCIHFLWPSYTRQVLVRERRRRQLNLFQEHLLRLCNAGLRQPEQLAELMLSVGDAAGDVRGSVQLIRRILVELERIGAVDASAQPTALGRALLDGGGGEADELAARHTFQDPWTGELWRRFPDIVHSGILEVSWSKGDSGELHATLARGQRGRPRDRGFVIRPDDAAPCPRPSDQDIRRGHDGYLTDLLFLLGQPGDDEAAQVFDLAPPGRIAEIVDIGDPEPVYLQGVVFIPEPRSASRDRDTMPWEAADPFGLGVNRAFRERIDQVGRRKDMAMFFAWLQQRVDEETRNSGESVDDNLSERADRLIDQQLGSGIRRHFVVYEELLRMQYAALAAEQHIAAGEWREAGSQIRQAINTAQIALEWTFKTLAQTFPTRGVYATFDLVPGERQASARELARVARTLGYAGDASGEFPARLTHVDAGKIRAAADKNRGSLNAFTWAAMLVAANDKKHPLARATVAYPELLLDLSDIAGKRDEVSHAVHRPEEYRSALAKVVADTGRIARVLLVDG